VVADGGSRVVRGAPEEGSFAGREPFASDQAQTPRIWVRGTKTAVVGAYIHDDGSLDADGTLPTSGPVTSMSMKDGPDHSHITWTEDLGGGKSRCFASDIRYIDSMIVVWQTAGHIVEARYLASTGDIMRDMSLHGRKPKVRFDGTEFWIAWVDEGAGDQLHLASFDLSGNVKDVALPGWQPVGDEAFQLVAARRGGLPRRAERRHAQLPADLCLTSLARSAQVGGAVAGDPVLREDLGRRSGRERRVDHDARAVARVVVG
jgi:hypothetical protein